MAEQYLPRQTRRCNRNLLLINGLLALVVLGTAGVCWRYLYNFCFGPFPMDPDTLAKVKDPKDLLGYYVTVKSDWVLEEAGQLIEEQIDPRTHKVISRNVRATYVKVLLQGKGDPEGKNLLVRVSPGFKGKEYTGALRKMDQGVMSHIVLPEERKSPQSQGTINRQVLLDATGFRGPGYWGLGIGLPLLGLAVWNLGRGISRARHPERHPMIAHLARFGDPGETAERINQEVEQEVPGASLKTPVITSSWLCKPRFFGLQIIPLADVVWVYKKVTKHSTNGIPTGTSYAAVINRSDGQSLEIRGSESGANQVLQHVFQRVPWILAGFNNELARLWKKDRDTLLGVVKQRQTDFLEALRNQEQASGGELPPPAQPAG